MKIKITKNNQEGEVKYNKVTKAIIVDFPAASVKKDIEKYLETKHEFRIPESAEIDDFRVDNKYPKENLTYFELAMCNLYAHTGVWVVWE